MGVKFGTLFFYFIIKSFPCPINLVRIISIIAQITAPTHRINQNASQAPFTFSQSKTQVAISNEIITPNFAHLTNAGILNPRSGWIVIKPAIATTKPSTILFAIIVHIIGLDQDHCVIATIDGSIFGFEANPEKHNKPNNQPNTVQRVILFANLFKFIYYS